MPANVAEFHREYLVRLPLPLAQLYSRAFNAKEARARHDNAFYLFESLVKLAAAPVIAAYLAESQHAGVRVKALDQLLAQLALPSLGQWVAILRELSRHFGARADSAAHPLGHLRTQLESKHRDRPAILALFRRIKNGPDGVAEGDQSCSLLDLLDALVQYRNGVFGHGAGRFNTFYEQEMGPLLLPAASELLAEGLWDFLGPRGSRLVYLTELRTVEEGKVQISLLELVGRESERMAPQELLTAEAAMLVPNSVAVLWPGRRVPLRLDPLLVFRGTELAEEVLFLNRDRNGRQAEYLSYTTGRTERDKSMAPALAKLLSQVTGREVSESDLEKIGQQSLAETPSVEALFGPGLPAVNQVGDYEILAELGRGGMGVVYLARQLSLGRLVALKMLPADLAADEVALARFRREMRALGRCEHPHIVKVLANGTLPDGRLYYTMEYVPGADLEMTWRELAGPNRQSAASTLGGTTWSKAVLTASRKQREAVARHAAESSAASGESRAESPLTPDPSPARGEGSNQPAGTSAPSVLPLPPRTALSQLPLPPLPELPSAENAPGDYSRRVARLIRDAALALQAVHEQGIVHRDVKPANLMLTPDGQRVVLMDFGLAKGQSVSLSASKAGGLLGTLRYAAPEQLAAASLKVGPTADVRGLGVTLWELLTRERLFGDAEDERQLAALVHDQDVPRLRSVDPTLDADLEAIVARATERRVADRIQTAGKLAEYLQLYLDGHALPIRPPSAAELLRRWVSEHKGLVSSAAAAAVAILLTVAIAFLSINAAKNDALLARNDAVEAKNRAVQLAADKTQLADEKARLANTEKRSRQLADEQSQLALATLKSVVFDIESELVNVPRTHEIRKRLLNTAIAGLEKVARGLDTANDADHAMIVSRLELGDTFHLVGGDKGSSAIGLARQQYETARQIAQKLVDANPHDVQAQRDLMLASNSLGVVDVQSGNVSAAHDAYQKGLDIGLKLAQADPTSAQAQRDVALSVSRLGDVQMRLGNVSAARDDYQKYLDISLMLLRSDPTNVEAQRDLCIAYNRLGDVVLRMGNLPTARNAYQNALNISVALAQADPTNAQAQGDLAYANGKLGDVNSELGNWPAAREAYQKGLDINLRLAQADPTNVEVQRNVYLAYNDLGDVNLRMDNKPAARDVYQKGAEISLKLAQADATNAQAQRDLSISYGKLGDVNLEMENLSVARESYQKQLDTSLKLAQADPASAEDQRDLSISFNRLGNVNLQLGDLPAARDAYQKEMDIVRKLAQSDPTNAQAQGDLALSCEHLGDLNLELSNLPAARENYQQEIAVRLKLVQADPAHPEVQRELAVTYDKLGDVNLQLGDLPAARDAHEKDLEIIRKLVEADPNNDDAQADLANSLLKRGLVEKSEDDLAAARKWFEPSVAILAKLDDEKKLANQSLFQGWLDDGKLQLQLCAAVPRALDDLEFALGQPNDVMEELLAIRGRYLARHGHPDDAAATAEKLIALDSKDADKLFEAARVYALCPAPLAPAKVSADQKRSAEYYASRAVELLKQAQELGHFKDADNRISLKYNHNFDSLRDRDDFKKLLAEAMATASETSPALSAARPARIGPQRGVPKSDVRPQPTVPRPPIVPAGPTSIPPVSPPPTSK